MKSLKIVNCSKFKEWLEDIKNGVYYKEYKIEIKDGAPISMLSKHLELPYRTVANWFQNEKPRLSSNSLKRIFEKFPNLEYSDLGVMEVDDRKEESLFRIRFNQLMKERNLTPKELASEFKLDKSAISSWSNGTSLPKEENFIQLSKLFNVSTEFLKGTTNMRKRVELTKTLSDTLDANSPDTIVEFMENKFLAKDLEEQYPDLPEHLLNNRFLYVLREEINRIVEWYTDDSYYGKFENTINEREILGQTVSYTHTCNIKKIAFSNIYDELEITLNKYLDKILTDKGISNIDNRGEYLLNNKKQKDK